MINKLQADFKYMYVYVCIIIGGCGPDSGKKKACKNWLVIFMIISGMHQSCILSSPSIIVLVALLTIMTPVLKLLSHHPVEMYVGKSKQLTKYSKTLLFNSVT